MNFSENIKIALRSIKSNLLRAVLTLLIIAIGITCLVGMLTAIDTVLLSMSSSFNRMGANSFTISPSRASNNNGKNIKRGDPIIFKQAMDFKDNYDFPGTKVAINTFCKWNSTLKYKDQKTNPNIRLIGIDENYLSASSYELEIGRNFSKTEIENGTHQIIIGNEIVKLLFKDKIENVLHETISVGNTRYKVIGVLKSKGSTMTASNDRRVFIPIVNAKRYYGFAERNYSILASISDATKIDDAVSNAIGKMRNIRRLKAKEINDFRIRKSDGILETLKDMTTELRVSTIVIALMTLLGAAIGLMNIMLVSVTERTREIGVRKALGASRSNILFQFLVEAIVITIMGGILGIIFGIGIGGIIAALLKGQFIIPFNWMALAITVCVIVGVVSGLYPAIKASRLDPIEALRYQ